MKIGTKSVLFGAHQFAIHPWFVAWAWKRLYGWPRDPRLWVAFFLHDLGYVGKADMDGEEGESHPLWAALIMARLFDPVPRGQLGDWGWFCLMHSRFLARRYRQPFSRLCVADKLALALTPAWLYLPLTRATGEIAEYMKLAEARCEAGEPKYASMKVTTSHEARWYADVQLYMRKWVEAHKDGADDTWTPDMGARESRTETGVWR